MLGSTEAGDRTGRGPRLWRNMSGFQVVADSVFIAAFTILAAWHVVLLSRRTEPLWRAAIGWPGLPLRVCVALLLVDIVQLASDGRDSPGAWLGLAVAAAILAWSIGVLVRWQIQRARRRA